MGLGLLEFRVRLLGFDVPDIRDTDSLGGRFLGRLCVVPVMRHHDLPERTFVLQMFHFFITSLVGRVLVFLLRRMSGGHACSHDSVRNICWYLGDLKVDFPWFPLFLLNAEIG